MQGLYFILALSANAAIGFSYFAHQKDVEISRLAKFGAAPVYHDFLVQNSLVGGALVFGALGLFAIAAMCMQRF